MPTATRSSSKTPILILVVVLAVAVAAVGAYVYFNKQLGSPSVDELVALVPEDSTAVFLVRGIPKLAMDFNLEEILQTLREENEDFRRELEEAEDELGFDPTDRQALSEHGFDLLAPLGASLEVTGDPESPDVRAAFFVPTSDAEALDALIRRMAEQEDETLQDLDLDGTPVTGSADGATQYAFRDDYLVVSVSETQEGTSQYLKKILDGQSGSVTSAGWYQDQTELLDADWKMLALANLDILDSLGDLIAATQEGNPFAGQMMTQLEDLASVGLAFDLDPDRMAFSYRVTAVDDPTYPFDAALGDAEDELVTEIPGTALGAMRLAFDAEKTVDLLEEQSPDVQEMLQQAYQAAQGMGVDLENGVIPFLGSPWSLVVLEDMGQVPVGGAFWLPLEEGHAMGETLATVQGLLTGMDMPVAEDSSGEVTWYTINAGPATGRWGIARDHLVLAFGQQTSPAVASAMADGGESFLDGIERSEIVQGLTEEGDAFVYVDFPAILATVEKAAGEGGIPAQARPFLDNLGVMYGRTDYEPNVGESEIRLFAAQPGGFAEMLEAGLLEGTGADAAEGEPST